jgi:hypothetical protein
MFLVVLIIVTRYVLRHIGCSSTPSNAGRWRPTTSTGSRLRHRLVRIGVIAFAAVVTYPYTGSGSDAFKGISFPRRHVSMARHRSSRTASRATRRIAVRSSRRSLNQRSRRRRHRSAYSGDLRSLKNEDVIVPNSMILNSGSSATARRRKTRRDPAHDRGDRLRTSWRQVEAMLSSRRSADGRSGGPENVRTAEIAGRLLRRL